MSNILTIQHKQGKLRSKPSFLSRVKKYLPYGTKVRKVEEKSTWIKVQAEDHSGWLHRDTLTNKEIVLQAGSENVETAASDDELVLAGKGFSENVEKDYRQRNPQVNFAPVNKMEQFSVSEEALTKFVEAGDLNHG